MLPIELTDRIAVVTGATGQLGRVMARTLAKCGADVAIHYHSNEAKARELADDITEHFGRRAIPVTADVSDMNGVFALRNTVREKLGEADIVVTNAVAQIHPWTTVLEEDLADYESQWRSCVLQNVLFAKAFVPGMVTKKRGRFIGINTECTMQMHAKQSAYTSGKRGMDAVLRVLAKEVGAHQVTVNQVAPGWTISDRDREKGTEVSESYSASVPLKRRGTDQEIANVVAFLASDLASFITGAYVPVCGGNVMPTV